jgi:hypothetical protein
MNQVEGEQKSYRMPPQDGLPRRALSHRRRHRTIGSILRNGLRRSHSEQGRQQRRAGVHPDRGSLSTSGAVRHPTNHR